MSAFRDAISRRRQDLNPLTTALGPQHHQLPTPASAAGLSSQFGFNHQQQQPAYTPISTTREYNPQQWNGAAGNAVRYSPADAEAVPPPYSPPRSNRPATASPQDPSPSTMSPAHMSPAAINNRQSPEAVMNPIFPPPPGTRTRGNSRDRTPALFNLSFGRRQANIEPDRLSPELSRDHTTPVRRNAPAPLTIEPIQSDSPADAADSRPPAARRAASTGGIDTPSHSRTRSSSTARWAPGMPLPPPPPGPPPSGPSSRSQSLNRATENVTYQPTRRPQAVSSLGPVPPTPADWVEEEALQVRRPSPQAPRGLQLDTSNLGTNAPPESSSNPASGSGSAGLARAPAIRGEPKSIRERRSESRTGRTPHPDQPSNNPWAEAIAVTPSDITVPPNTVLGRRPAVTRGTPRSARSNAATEGPVSARSLGTPHLAENPDSRGSTPRPLNSARRPEAPTPPFSPDSYNATSNFTSPMIPPKSLPTPPPQRSTAISRQSPHQFNKSINEQVVAVQNSPALVTPRQLASIQNSTADRFSNDSIRRHSEFAEREAAAVTDEERVRLFAEFIVAESRLRRQRYASAIDAMGSEILELTRDLFRPYTSHQRGASNSFSSATSSRPEINSSRLTPQTGSRPGSRQESTPTSAADEPPKPQGRPDSAWFNTYMPSLSPIESVAHQSSKADESSSRGRPSSRWWEAGDTGSTGSQTGRLERSKRESKYMGHLRESLQWDENGSPSTSGTPRGTTVGSSSQTSYGPNEYPPEKVGWHEDASTSSYQTPTKSAFVPCSPAPVTPNPRHLDVSRLVTLPPPYPRHHPAVNNNHPDLAATRIQVRGLSDFSEIEATKSRFTNASESLEEEHKAGILKRRQSFRAGIQRNIEAGVMSYADAAKAEADFKVTENEAQKAQSKASFELFQSQVVGPLNDLLMERIDRAGSLSDNLRVQITSEAQSSNHDTTQEEGDEQPELLEKLTLLKWIFEAREQLHRELYNLLTERNDRYKDVVILPYRLAGNDTKIENAEKFFEADALKRVYEFEQASLDRTIAFMNTIETQVVHGVEIQLSAFWDIAPSLSQIVNKIPKEITREFGVKIPNEEYEDNPEYHEWPMQYLYSLLVHGEKSTYQFIESQINLLCLLHEVKSVVQAGKGRCEDAKWNAEGDGEENLEAKTARAEMERGKEEKRLTDDLKEKVKVVEGLWTSALGTDMEEVKERVREFLIEEGGWEGMEGNS